MNCFVWLTPSPMHWFATFRLFFSFPSILRSPSCNVSLSIMRRFTSVPVTAWWVMRKCRNLHGHNYSLEVYVTGQEQDEIGRILDFKSSNRASTAGLTKTGIIRSSSGKRMTMESQRSSHPNHTGCTNWKAIQQQRTWRSISCMKSAPRSSTVRERRPTKCVFGKAKKPVPRSCWKTIDTFDGQPMRFMMSQVIPSLG